MIDNFLVIPRVFAIICGSAVWGIARGLCCMLCLSIMSSRQPRCYKNNEQMRVSVYPRRGQLPNLLQLGPVENRVRMIPN